jgi:hypothetical protein
MYSRISPAFPIAFSFPVKINKKLCLALSISSSSILKSAARDNARKKGENQITQTFLRLKKEGDLSRPELHPLSLSASLVFWIYRLPNSGVSQTSLST